MNDDLLYLIALKKIPLIGDITAKKLIAHFGSAKNIFAQRRSSLEKVMGIGSKITQNILNSQYLQEAETELLFTEKEATAEGFDKKVVQGLLAMRPFFDFMTEALTTNLNGEPLFPR